MKFKEKKKPLTREKILSLIKGEISNAKILYATKEELIDILKNKIKSNIPTFKIDITSEAELKNKVKEIIKDSENAKQVFKIFDDYKIEMENNVQHTDKYYHTKANCDSAQLGILQVGWAILFSVGKEIKDYKYKIKHANMTKEAILKDCLQDLFYIYNLLFLCQR